ncbi:hypothetical protein PInf_027555 [Phytophthora infestans]|nr:hypothetical protein PInf_027555 [Phytophthora infestans]
MVAGKKLTAAEKYLVVKTYEFLRQKKASAPHLWKGGVRYHVKECLGFATGTISAIWAHWEQHHDKNFTSATEIASLHGHLVYYTPPYHPELQPIELIWADIKGRIADNPASDMRELRCKIYEGFASLTSDTWVNAYTHAQKYETKYLQQGDECEIASEPEGSNEDTEEDDAVDDNEAVAENGDTIAIQEAIRRERNQEQYVNPLIGRSVESRGQLGRDGKPNRDGVETRTMELLSRARVVFTAAMNATECLRSRAFQARANGDYDRAIKFYTSLSTAKQTAYRKNGDFEKAAQDYDLVQKNSGGSTTLADESVMYTAEHLYNTVKRATSPKKRIPQQSVHNDEIARGLEIEPDTNQDTNECQSEPDETEDALTAWTLQRSLEIARLPPSERSDSDLQYLLSAEYLESSEERFKVQEELDEAEMGASDVTWEPPWNTYQTPVNSDWKQTQLELCELEHGDIFGHQGRITNAPRAYSAITTTTCVIGALSWHQWSRIDRAQHEVERDRAARFLSMAPALNNIPVVDIRNLANRASL